MWKKCTPLWREADFEVKMHKTLHCRSTFQVAMWKKCTPLWPEAHFDVKMCKTHHVRTTLDVQPHHTTLHYSYKKNTPATSTATTTTATTTTATTTTTQHNTTLQLHHTTPHHTTFSSCVCVRCSKKHNSNHLSVHQWIRCAIHASQQLTSPMSIFETSATACGTTGIISPYISTIFTHLVKQVIIYTSYGSEASHILVIKELSDAGHRRCPCLLASQRVENKSPLLAGIVCNDHWLLWV